MDDPLPSTTDHAIHLPWQTQGGNQGYFTFNMNLNFCLIKSGEKFTCYYYINLIGRIGATFQVMDNF